MQQPPFFQCIEKSSQHSEIKCKRCFCYGQKIFDDLGMENAICGKIIY